MRRDSKEWEQDYRDRNYKSLKRAERQDSQKLCVCGCGKSRFPNRWYSPNCSRWKSTFEVVGGEARHNGVTMGSSQRGKV